MGDHQRTRAERERGERATTAPPEYGNCVRTLRHHLDRACNAPPPRALIISPAIPPRHSHASARRTDRPSARPGRKTGDPIQHEMGYE